MKTALVLAVVGSALALVCGALLAYPYLMVWSSFDAIRCYDVTDRHPDATSLQHDLAGLPGVARAEVDYRAYVFDPERECPEEAGESRTVLDVVVALDARAPSGEQLAVVRAATGAFAGHLDWGGTLRLELGTDRLTTRLPVPSSGEPDLAGQVGSFDRSRSSGTLHASLRATPGGGLELVRVRR